MAVEGPIQTTIIMAHFRIDYLVRSGVWAIVIVFAISGIQCFDSISIAAFRGVFH